MSFPQRGQNRASGFLCSTSFAQRGHFRRKISFPVTLQKRAPILWKPLQSGHFSSPFFGDAIPEGALSRDCGLGGSTGGSGDAGGFTGGSGCVGGSTGGSGCVGGFTGGSGCVGGFTGGSAGAGGVTGDDGGIEGVTRDGGEGCFINDPGNDAGSISILAEREGNDESEGSDEAGSENPEDIGCVRLSFMMIVGCSSSFLCLASSTRDFPVTEQNCAPALCDLPQYLQGTLFSI